MSNTKESATIARVAGTVRRNLPTLVKFGLVGISGLFINTLALLWLGEGVGVHYLVAVIGATQFSTLWNFALTEKLVFTPSSPIGRGRRLVGFAALNNGALLVRGPMVVFMTEQLAIHYAVANIASLVIVLLFRYVVSVRLLWRKPGDQNRQASPAHSFSAYRDAGHQTEASQARDTNGPLTP